MWEFIGKTPATDGPLRIAIVGPTGGEESNEAARIFTAGPDGRVNEFEASRMRPRDGLRLCGSTKVQMAGRATALTLAPTGLAACQPAMTPSLILADDMLKIHLVDVENKRKTLSVPAPSYASQGIRLLQPFKPKARAPLPVPFPFVHFLGGLDVCLRPWLAAAHEPAGFAGRPVRPALRGIRPSLPDRWRDLKQDRFSARRLVRSGGAPG